MVRVGVGVGELVAVLVGAVVGVLVEVAGIFVLVGVSLGIDVGVLGTQLPKMQRPSGHSSSPQQPLAGTQPNPFRQHRCPSAQHAPKQMRGSGQQPPSGVQIASQHAPLQQTDSPATQQVAPQLSLPLGQQHPLPQGI